MTSNVAHFNRTYHETLSLLIETRNYVAYREARDQLRLSLNTRLQASLESMRVTSRLTQVMAWLLAQRAVQAGEMSQEEAASDHFALAGGRICEDPSGPENEELPSGLRSLLTRSHSLYMRVHRLDRMVRDHVRRNRAN